MTMTPPRRTRLARQLALSTALGGLAALSYGRQAQAGSCYRVDGSFYCSGPANPGLDGPVTVSRSGPLTGTTALGFGIDATEPGDFAALLIQSEGGVSFTTGEAVTLTARSTEIDGGEAIGLDVTNSLSGGVRLDMADASVSGDGIGIRVRNAGSQIIGQADLTVTTGDVTGGTYGIDAAQAAESEDGADLYLDTTAGTVTATSEGGGRHQPVQHRGLLPWHGRHDGDHGRRVGIGHRPQSPAFGIRRVRG